MLTSQRDDMVNEIVERFVRANNELGGKLGMLHRPDMMGELYLRTMVLQSLLQ
jgi:hypothetical protein